MFTRLHSFLNIAEIGEKTPEKPLTDAPTKINVENKEPFSPKTATQPVKTFYLVDFENIKLQGLDVVEKFDPKTERICVFSTENAPKIPTSTLAKILEIQKSDPNTFEVHEVPVKSQSVDMHLVSYLGYLVGVYGKTCQYVVLSNDTDYDNIVKYWKMRGKVDVKRQGCSTTAKKNTTEAAPKQPEPTTPKQTTSKPAAPDQVGSKPVPVSLIVLPSNTELNNLILKAVIKAGYSAQTAGKVASTVCKNRNNDNFLDAVIEKLKEAFPNSEKLLQTVKTAINNLASPPNAKTPSNTPSVKYSKPRSAKKTKSLKKAVTQILTTAKFTPEEAAEIATIAGKKYDKVNPKQVLNTALIKQYGQKKGAKIYDLLKGLF